MKSNSIYYLLLSSWAPTWSVSTILTGLLSFMLETSPTYGSIQSTDADKRRLAKDSLKFNLQNAQFCELFPEIADEIREKLDKDVKSPSSTERSTDTGSISSRVDHRKILKSILLNLALVGAFIIVVSLCKYVVSLPTTKS